MNRLATLFSSSSGNCVLISNSDTNILIDAGVSASKIIRSLGELSLDICEIDAILVTHEHSDHIAGVGTLSRNYNIPVYANSATMAEIISSSEDLYERSIRIINQGTSFTVRSMEVTPFSIPHDAADPVGYTIFTEDKRISVATDTGHITKAMLMNMSRSDSVLIESNHDVDMVKNGKYPYVLKKRILSDTGHLSNDKAAWLSTQLAMWGTKKIMLGHLSENNNTLEKAFETTKRLLEENNFKINQDVILKVAMKNQITFL